ncbi:cellulase family glycosylhydrolase [Pelagicoccus mobilis]|uniref:Cellulase family glycosylhydrolase n=1 Tax=Pelagicoccus mobilis TaxID=415221 RepID=A0A934VQY0_9BACT|nr:cellulase family glycosylhydrolase [Pelagicoccus mobilis]MBK1877370.1 cellulase family glycosylhydrolase [Pelagicoccus mobilis]
MISRSLSKALKRIASASGLTLGLLATSTQATTPLFEENLSNASFPKGVWKVKNGILSASEDKCIWTVNEYQDFVLDLEFRNSAGTNSGVIIYCSDTKNWIPNSVEIQIADDHSEKWAKADPSWQAGAFFGHKPAIQQDVVAPAGSWNRMTVTASGPYIVVEMNGELVNRIDLGDFTSATEAPDGTKIPEWLSKPWAELPTVGKIGFQGKHAGAPIEFRNMSIRSISDLELSALRSANGELRQSTQSGLVLGQGVNLSHWLSQRGPDREWPDSNDFFTAADVALLASQGWDHVRLPIEESIMWKKNGKRNKEAFETLDTVITWIEAAGLKAIVDLHIVNSHHFNAVHDGGENTLFTSEASQELLCDLWRDLSSFLNKWDNDFLAYEVLNEAVADEHDQWNFVIAKAINAVRELEPNRPIVVGSNRWQLASSFPFLRLPSNDPNLILSYHFYSPFRFTHYQASWVGHYYNYNGPINYPGLLVTDEQLAAVEDEEIRAMLEENQGPHGKEAMRQEMMPAMEYARIHQLPLYLGEWGCLKTVDRDDLLVWYRDVGEILREEGINHAIWDYQGNFGIKDYESGKVDTELLQAILGQ